MGVGLWPRGHRAHLRARAIAAVIPEPAGQADHRVKRGSNGGRPVSYDAQDYKQRNVIEGRSTDSSSGAASPPRYDKHALVYRGAVVLASILFWLR